MGFDIIQFRKQYPDLWKTILFLGSIQWAGILLLLIALACAIATFMESSFSSAVAREYIYHAPWFYVWLVALCVNLLCVTITRLPWKKKHYGFVITHYGIITLLFGAMIGSWFGFEAFATLKMNEEPSYRLTENKTVLIVQSPEDLQYYSIDLPIEVKKPTEKKPRIISIPHSPLSLKIDQHASHVERVPYLVPALDNSGGYGVMIELSSPIMEQKIKIPFHTTEGEQQTFDFFGMARISWVSDLKASTQSLNSWMENQMIFLNSAPILSNTSGLFSGYQFQIQKNEDSKLLVNLTTPEGKQATFAIPSRFPQKIPLPDSKIEAVVDAFWPDFEMKDGKPFSKSSNLNNPALLIRIQGKRPIDTKPTLLLSAHNQEFIQYAFLRDGKVSAQGQLGLGTPLSTGWAQWSVELKDIQTQSHLEYRIEPRPATNPENVPGIRVQLLDEKKKPLSGQKWIVSGETENLAISSTQVIQLAFGLKTRPIDFGVQLNRFDVPRDEGTDTPAGFISTVWFYDENRNLAREDHAEMNYPATYPGGLWRSVVGLNYKFSQASWNPQNLNESTLQVLFDPGWPLKWIGSLMISFGILVMYYYREKKNAD